MEGIARRPESGPAAGMRTLSDCYLGSMPKKTARILAPLALVSALGLGPHLVGATDAAGPAAATPARSAPATSTSAPSVAPTPKTVLVENAKAVPAARRPALTAPGLDRHVVAMAEDAAARAVSQGLAKDPRTLTVIDYSLPSTEKRLWVFDVRTGELLFHELVAHGRNTGDNRATRFSNTLNSKQTSLGLFVTANTYVGSNGYSLRMQGLDRGFNDRAMERAIVIHGAPYVSEAFARSQGRIGRSWGCPALDQKVSRQVIDTIKGGDLVFAYAPQDDFLTGAPMLAGSRAAATVLASTAGTATTAVGR
jgi:hypothetical protein